ncbi:hypothetical protein [Microvirga arsenatis]|uniref:MerR family transcriptional regulator n=1 Tax=Microvirga arsenatis TaxID=2692265 RepID=A0ABW9Z7K9_9HYPH|nr:hypothetical protein [Microvirga arsenatis]NBJ13135.1 hypothetical protein [Microvirga arsenatis]NBJ26886.1 hypothetical protein [Microvirga arsenatis]
MLTLEEFQLRLDVDAGTVQVWIEEGWLLLQRDQAGFAFSDFVGHEHLATRIRAFVDFLAERIGRRGS